MFKKVKLKQVSIIASLLLVVGLSACTPEQIASYQAHLASQSRDCNEAVDKYFSGDKNRMKQIVWRESRNNPSAQNSRSTAAGCTQMLALHAHRFNAVGCSWGQRYNADCNIKAADHLYRQAGWSPWNL